jgi:hypothetical protein
VRDDPALVDAVAREAAADLVVHAAAGHRAQRVQGHPVLAAAQEELDERRRRELRRAAEAAVLGVVGAAQVNDGGVEPGGVESARRRDEVRGAGEPRHDPLRVLGDLGPLLAPGLLDPREDLRPARHPAARAGRVVGAREERHAVRVGERVERPAAVAGHGLDGLHVDRVDVRALLAIDLDAHEVAVHGLRDRRVLEGLALHHVAPVAGRVADRDEHRLVLRAGAREGLFSPRVPVDRVLRVLEEIRGGFLREAVGHAGSLGCCP